MAQKTIAIHQPNYLPNLSYFYKMACADEFVIVTNLQFEKLEGWQRRNRIKTANTDLWLTVPVKGSRTQKIKDVMIDGATNWQHCHKSSLQMNYSKSTEQQLLNHIAALYDRPWERLVDLNVAIILLMKEMLGITTPVILDEEVEGCKHSLIINTCKKYGADAYLSGLGARSYTTQESLAEFERSSIEHRYVDQDHGSQYPYTALHYVLANGKDAAMKLVEQPMNILTASSESTIMKAYAFGNDLVRGI